MVSYAPSHHRYLHRLKNLLSFFGAVFAFRVFVWEPHYRVSFRGDAWYRFSAIAEILMLLFQMTASVYRSLTLGPCSTKERLYSLFFGDLYESPTTVTIHRLQSAWAALWVINLLIEISVGSRLPHEVCDLSLLLSVYVAQIGLLIPVVLTMGEGYQTTTHTAPVLGAGDGIDPVAPPAPAAVLPSACVLVLRWASLVVACGSILVGVLLVNASELTSMWMFVATIGRMDRVEAIHVFLFLWVVGLYWFRVATSETYFHVDVYFAWIFSFGWLACVLLVGRHQHKPHIHARRTAWKRSTDQLVLAFHLVLLDVLAMPSLFMGAAGLVILTKRFGDQRLYVHTLVLASFVETALLLERPLYRHDLTAAVSLCLLVLSRVSVFIS